MSRSSCTAARLRRPFGPALLLCCLVSVVPVADTPVARADDGNIVRIEEDWELAVTSTDPNSAAPQVVTVFAPVGEVDGWYATFEINHQSTPDFQSGGLHLQVWHGDDLQDTVCHDNHAVMNSAGEVVRWTQRMRLEDGKLYFSVRNGASTTWGAFGSWGTLWQSVPTTLSSLGGYDPESTVKNSGVGYGGNRVSSLVLKEVRRYRADGEVIVDSKLRVVHAP